MNDELIKAADINLGVVCPMANEAMAAERFLKELIKECAAYGFKTITIFVIIDNASKDKTLDICKKLSSEHKELKVIWAPENKCIVHAYVRGYKEALAAGCDWVLEIDAGFSHQPSEAKFLFDKMVLGYDCVFGSRFCKGGNLTESSIIRHIISRGGTVLANLLLGTQLKDMTSGFELFSRSALNSILEKGLLSHSPFFQTEIKAYAHQFNITEVPIHYRAASHAVSLKVLKAALIDLGNLYKIRKSLHLKKEA